MFIFVKKYRIALKTSRLNITRLGGLISILGFTFASCSDNTPVGNELINTVNTSPVEITVSSIDEEFNPSRVGAAASRVYTDASPLATEYLGHNLSLTYFYDFFGDGKTRSNVKWEDDSIAADGLGNKIRIWQQMSEMSKPMMWTNPATQAAEVYAYAPYVEVSNPMDLFAIPFKVESNQKKGIVPSDFVRFYNTSFTPGPSLKKLPIYFDHQLCKLTITLKEGPTKTITQGQIDSLAECKIGWVCDSINFDLFAVPPTQSSTIDKFPVTTISGNKKDSTMIYTWVPEECDSSTQICILPPQTIKKDSAFIHVNIYDPNTCFQRILVYRPEKNLELKPNHHYKITVELCDTELKLSEVIVEGWIRENEAPLNLVP